MAKMNNSKLIENFLSYRKDWNRFARDILGLRLDQDQQEILYAVQTNRRVSVRSGNARGKDFVAAAASLCFLYLNVASKLVCTGPTDRQVKKIMMTEIRKIHKNARIPLGGEIFENQIKFPRPDWFLIAFKAVDYKDEVWTGFHSPHLMVVVTEASGIEQQTFNNIESILTGDSRLLIVFNPNRTTGEAYNSVKSPLYQKFKLSCLDAPNVKARKTIISGQVDYDWVVEKINKWCTPINPPPGYENSLVESPMVVICTPNHDFRFEGQWYRPNDLFRIKVLGEFPEKSDNQLIPLAWIEAANERWKERQHDQRTGNLVLGVDVAGMGSDLTVFCHRYDDFIAEFQTYQHQDEMQIAGQIKNILSTHENASAQIDTIGQGAGVYSRLNELKMEVTSAKFSHSAHKENNKEELTDFTGEHTFANMRAYCYWAIRDALDPQHNGNLALPPIDELTQDLTEPRYRFRSDSKILIEEKSEIKKRLGRSPDYADALALAYYPKSDLSHWPSMAGVIWRTSSFFNSPSLCDEMGCREVRQFQMITDDDRLITRTIVPLRKGY